MPMPMLDLMMFLIFAYHKLPIEREYRAPNASALSRGQPNCAMVGKMQPAPDDILLPEGEDIGAPFPILNCLDRR
jgi:hypothetical protein